MKAFRFETVLKERARIEELKLQELSGIQRQLQVSMSQRTELNLKLSTIINRSYDFITTADLSVIDSFISGLKQKIATNDFEIELIAKQQEVKSQEYRLASQKKKALEKLKEKYLQEHKQKVNSAELNSLDESYITRNHLRPSASD